MRKFQMMYYAGAAISLLVGLWHFTVPWMFGWASYIPYATLMVPIDYVNLCFSFLLSGLSLTVILWGKKVFARNHEAVYIYGFLLLLWIFRVAVAIVYPCPPESNVWMSYGQLVGSVVVSILLLVPFIWVASTCRKEKTGEIAIGVDLYVTSHRKKRSVNLCVIL